MLYSSVPYCVVYSAVRRYLSHLKAIWHSISVYMNQKHIWVERDEVLKLVQTVSSETRRRHVADVSQEKADDARETSAECFAQFEIVAAV